MTSRVKVAAKLNLTLEVTGRENGYHLLDSLVVSVDLFDTIVARPRRDGAIKINMHGMGSEMLPPEKNNALKAAHLFRERFSSGGADITVWKNIPMGAGMGGSSADIAGVLLALSELYEEGKGKIAPLADELGSDSKYQLTGGFARLKGRGEHIETFPVFPQMYFLVVCPETGVNTAECFVRFDALFSEGKNPKTDRTVPISEQSSLLTDGMKQTPSRTDRALELLVRGSEQGARLFGNDLTGAAISLNPAIGQTLAALKSLSPLSASMTGSGSGCFAAFETRELADWARTRYRGKGRPFVVSPL